MIRTEHREPTWAFPFVLYAPQNPQGPLPLVVQLHGAGERGNGQEELARVDVHGFSKLLQERDYPCLVVMPQCPTGSFWAAQVESILTFVGQLLQAYDVDPSRVSLTGLSMGGYGTWYTAMAKPSLFAAIAPVCGGGMAWNASVLDMPVWAFHGTADSTVHVVQSDEMVEALRAAGRDVTYTRLEGVGHGVWMHTYDDELMGWLLSKRR